MKMVAEKCKKNIEQQIMNNFGALFSGIFLDHFFKYLFDKFTI